ncbi:MAG: putative 2OG-Fe(II) oxygenase, partial [Cyanobacteria bacterium P01_D01_bin.44]
MNSIRSSKISDGDLSKFWVAKQVEGGFNDGLNQNMQYFQPFYSTHSPSFPSPSGQGDLGPYVSYYYYPLPTTHYLLPMPLDTWFPLAIYYHDLPDAAQHKAPLLKAVLDLEQSCHERRNFPEMAWTGDLHGVERIHTNPQFAWIVDQVETHTLNYLQELGLDLSKVELYIQRAWPVVSRHQQEVGSHCHNTAHISAVYYIEVPQSGTDEAGCLVFFDDARLNEVSPGLGSENTDIIANWN